MTVLQINSPRTCFNTPMGIVKAVGGLSLEINIWKKSAFPPLVAGSGNTPLNFPAGCGNVIAMDLFQKPLHLNTKGLLRAIPSSASSHREKLYEIQGTVPSLLDLPAGCRFNTRCPEVEDICRRKEPELREIEPGWGLLKQAPLAKN